MNFPRPSLQNFVRTLLEHGNTPENLDLNRIAHFNKWTDADQLLVEFRLQQNGERRLPEEEAVGVPASSGGRAAAPDGVEPVPVSSKASIPNAEEIDE